MHRVQLKQHRIYLFYTQQRQPEQWQQPPYCGDLLKLFQASGDEHSWIYPDAQERIKDDYGKKNHPVWQRSSWKLGSDLHPHIAGALGQLSEAQGREQVADATIFEPSKQARNAFVDGELVYQPKTKSDAERKRKRLKLALPPIAKARIAEQLGKTADTIADPTINIRDYKAISFRTGWLVYSLAIELQLEDTELTDTVWLQEALASLSKINDLYWQNPVPKADDKPKRFSLGTLVRRLAGSASSKAGDRCYSSTYIRLSQEPENLKTLLTQLSRRYTNAYELAKQQQGIETVAEFTNVQHGFALEGCATAVICDDDGPDFLLDYLNNTYPRHYLPITLLAVHEYYHLVNLTTDSSFWPEIDREASRGNKADSLQQLERLRDNILKFRLCFRYSNVSRIGMHNEVNSALRRVLNLDAMLNELDLDTREISAFLAKQTTDTLEQRFRWMNILAVGFIVFWSSHEVLTALQPFFSCVASKTYLSIELGLSLCLSLSAALVIKYKNR